MRSHHPPHLLLDNTWYFVSASTVGCKPLLASDGAKQILRDVLKQVVIDLRLTLKAWVILDDHYHLLLRSGSNCNVSAFVRRLHGSSSRQINLQEAIEGRRVWDNYWDTCIRGEQDCWPRFNYIHHNPVKHGYVHSMGDWPFSSYQYYLRALGSEWLDDCWMRYPVVDYSDGIS